MTERSAKRRSLFVLLPVACALLLGSVVAGCSSERWVGVDAGRYDAVRCPAESHQASEQAARELEIDREGRLALLTLTDATRITMSFSHRKRARWAAGCPTNLYTYRMEVLDIEQEKLTIGPTTLVNPVLVRDCPADPVNVVLRGDGDIGNAGGVSGTACSRSESCFCFEPAPDLTRETTGILTSQPGNSSVSAEEGPERSASGQRFDAAGAATTSDRTEMMGYIVDFSEQDGLRYVSLDKIEWFSGEAAAEARLEDGLCSDLALDCDPPNPFYIRNSDESLNTFRIADDAAVLMQTLSHAPNGNFNWDERIDVDQFVEIMHEARFQRLRSVTFHIAIEGDAVVVIREQYNP